MMGSLDSVELALEIYKSLPKQGKEQMKKAVRAKGAEAGQMQSENEKRIARRIRKVESKKPQVFNRQEKVSLESNPFDSQRFVNQYINVKNMNSLMKNYAQLGNFEKVRESFDKGATQYDEGLACACSGNRVDMVPWFLKNGARDLKKAAVRAIKSGSSACLLELMKGGLVIDSELYDEMRGSQEAGIVSIYEQVTKTIQRNNNNKN